MIRGIAKARSDFERDLRRTRVFLTIERRIKNPVSARSRPRSETLLSGWAVLNCGRLEQYLQEAFGAALTDWRNRIGNPRDTRLKFPGHTEALEWQNIEGFMERFARSKFLPRADRIAEVEAFAASIASGLTHPQSFQNTNANPNWATLKTMASRLRIADLKSKLAAVYSDPLGRSLSGETIESTLETFIRNRNEAAHSGRMTSFTRVDAVNTEAYLFGLVASVSTVLDVHVSSVV